MPAFDLPLPHHWFPRLSAPAKVLQVYVGGQACGWLGYGSTGYWFHYNRGHGHQPWVGLLMPPSQNFYSSPHLFGPFAQHLPSANMQSAIQTLYPHLELGPLDFLHLLSGQLLGNLSFSNPDNLMVRPRRIFKYEQLAKMSSVQLAEQLPSTPWPGKENQFHWLVQTDSGKSPGKLVVAEDDKLHVIKRIDWCEETNKVLGFEHASSVLNLPPREYSQWLNKNTEVNLVLDELFRTYCPFSVANNTSLAKELKEHVKTLSLTYSSSMHSKNKNDIKFVY